MRAMAAPADRLVIALAQIPSIVGDIEGNLERLRQARAEAAGFGADLVMAPELYLAGYPPEDLVLKPAFQEACRAACETLARETADGGPAVLVGPALGRGRRAATTPRRCSTAGASKRCASRSICPITACSTKSACSGPAPRRGRSSFAACASACRSARTSGGPIRSNASPRRAAKSCSSPTARLTSATSSTIRLKRRRRRASPRAACR